MNTFGLLPVMTELHGNAVVLSPKGSPNLVTLLPLTKTVVTVENALRE
jgi:hypothetical protein